MSHSRMMEGRLSSRIRRLFIHRKANCSNEGRAVLVAGDIPDELGFEEAVNAFTNPGQRTASLEKAAPKNKHVTSRAFDKWCTTAQAHENIGARMQTIESAGRKLVGKTREKLRKRVSWELWRKLSLAARESWEGGDPTTPKRKCAEADVPQSAPKRRKRSDDLHNLGVGIVAAVEAAVKPAAGPKARVAKALFQEACISGGLSAKSKRAVLPACSKWRIAAGGGQWAQVGSERRISSRSWLKIVLRVVGGAGDVRRRSAP